MMLKTFAAAARSCAGVGTNILECEGGGTAGVWHTFLLIVEILSIGIGILGFIGILIFGIQYLTAKGNVEQTAKAKKRLFQIILGLGAYAVMFAFIVWIMPGGGFTPPNDVTGVTVNLGQTTVEVGRSTTAKATITPSDAKDKSYSLSSDKPAIASIGGGAVRCQSEGTATITATTVNNQTGSATITCIPASNPESSDDQSGNSGRNTPSGTAFSKDDFISAYNSMSTPSYAEVKNLAKSIYGDKLDDYDFIAILAWTRNENYWEHDLYYNYLCSCSMINKALAGEDVYAQVNGGYEGYQGVGYYGTQEFLESGSGYTRQANDAALKTAYLALKNLDTRPYAAHGIVNENGYSYYGNWGKTVQRTSEAFYCTHMLDGTMVCAWDSSADWYAE